MTTTTNMTTATESDSVRQRLRDVGLYGLAAQDHALLTEPWVERVIDIEDRERKRRSLERRLTNARIGAFKPIADFDWTWPKRIDQLLIEELFSLAFVHDATNIVLVGPNGVGKTMLIKNLLHHAVLNGFTARFTTASDMLHELAAQDSDASLARRLRRFTACCLPLCLVGSPRDLAGLFRRRFAWDGGAIREASGRDEVAFVMNDCC